MVITSGMEVFETKDEAKCCVSCVHNIRVWTGGNCRCHCEIDGHYIGYVQAFALRCRRWKGEKYE